MHRPTYLLAFVTAVITSVTSCALLFPPEPEISVSPPEWIVGTWEDESTGDIAVFTSSDIILNGVSAVSWSENNEQSLTDFSSDAPNDVRFSDWYAFSYGEPGTDLDSSIKQLSVYRWEDFPQQVRVITAPAFSGFRTIDLIQTSVGGDTTGPLFEWQAGDGLSPWTLGGNNQGVGSVTIDSQGNLLFQVDFDALRSVATPAYDLRGRTVDVQFVVTGGSGYSQMSILQDSSDTAYSVGNSYVGTFLISRDTTYYLRLVFDANGSFTRTLSLSGFGQSDVRQLTGTRTDADSLAVPIHLANSHNSATTMRVEQVAVY